MVGEVLQGDHPFGLHRERLLGVGGNVLHLLRRHDEFDAVGHAFDRDHLEALAVAFGVRIMECSNHVDDCLCIDIACRQLDKRCLPALAEESPIETASDLEAVGDRTDVIAERALHLGEHIADLVGTARIENRVGAARFVEHLIGGEKSQRREEAWIRRNDGVLEWQQLQHRRQQHRTRRTIGHQREIANIDTMTHRDIEYLLGNIGHRKSVGRAHPLSESDRCVQCVERRSGCLAIQGHLTAGERVAVKNAHEQACISDRWDRPSAPVAGRAGFGTGRARPHLNAARGGDGDETAASGTHAGNLSRQRVDDQIVFELKSVLDKRTSVDDQ
ncbi:Uncharacterised protein [Mycobacteroides abscessus subsp. abscessus]|nr:Uncharacterised protein [Mycobacteroides abscessus subsp. abscessus]